MNRWGIHLANGEPGDFDDLLRLGVSCYTLLHYQADYALLLRDHAPDGVIHVRFYLPRWRDRAPGDWGRECGREYNRTRRCVRTGREFSLESVGARVTLANEMNLPEESGGWSADDYRAINAWHLRAGKSFRDETGVTVDWAAVAQGHSDDQADLGYVGLELCREAIEEADWLHVHQYWSPGRVCEFVGAGGEWLQGPPEPSQPSYPPKVYNGPWRFVLTHELFPSKRMFVSEAGQFDTRRADAPEEIVRWFKSLYHFDYLEGATPFIFRDPTHAHYGNDWGQNRDIERRVAAEPKRDVATAPPDEEDHSDVSLQEQFPSIWDEWVKAGGPESHFRDHLLGIGAIQPTKDDLFHLINQTKAKLSELREALGRVPLR